MKNMRMILAAGSVSFLGLALTAIAWSEPSAYKIYGKAVSLAELEEADPATFYELAKKKYDQVEQAARSAYVEAFWQKEAKLRGVTVEKYRSEYFAKNVNISDREVKDTLDRFKDHPRLSKLSKKEQESQVREYLEDKERRELVEAIVGQGIKSGNLVVEYPRPKEPRYHVAVTSDDVHRYGAEPVDNKPVKCREENCEITVVEFSEFQCPFCKRILPDAKRVLKTYAGRIRWIVKDFPLSFHDRARPAAVASRCAGFQGKYWMMYEKLFEDQAKLKDADFVSHAKSIGLDMAKFNSCLKEEKAGRIVDSNFEAGVKVGVNGTPAFFINGRRLSGAIPYSEFQRIIEEELAQKGKS